jgi:glycerate kinase
MRVVVAPDKFKGCLSAKDVAAAITEGLRRADPTIDIEEIPLADGGEGTVDALVAATHGRLLTRRVTGPLPDLRVDATFGLLGDGQTAVIEMAAASGLHLLRPDQYDPTRTTTYGTGQLIMAAAGEGARQIILGIGGSATTDGGLGCAQACGVTFDLTNGATRARHDAPLTGADVTRVQRVTQLEQTPKLRAACDVDNPLFGPRGAARVFGPQKGATPEQINHLDAALQRLATLTPDGARFAHIPGAGAAGGLGFGLLAYLHATLLPGFELIAEALDLRRRLANADLVITGEGRLDSSSLGGKTAIGVARLCKDLRLPCIALVGATGEGADHTLAQGLTAYHTISHPGTPLEESIRRAPELLARAAENLLRSVRATR